MSSHTVARLMIIPILLTFSAITFMLLFDRRTFVNKGRLTKGGTINRVSTQLTYIEMQQPRNTTDDGERQDSSESMISVPSGYNGSAMHSTKNSEVPFRPFVENQPKSVIILAYQRTGSSFMGGMFHSDPNHMFYMFEPLDGLYSSLYGTPLGWNVPSDITSYSNGTTRILPNKEVAAVASFLSDVFTCDVQRWPVESLGHPYWSFFRSASGGFPQCILHRQLPKKLIRCHKNIAFYCGGRFGAKSEERLRWCNRLLTDETFRLKVSSAKVRHAFKKYIGCSKYLRRKADRSCTRILKTNCVNRKLRAVKTVRATMESMEPLLQKLPNFRIIHLVRDPRAVTLSRKKFGRSGRGQFSTSANVLKMMTNEAMLYCRTVARDVRTRRRLSARYPGRIFPVLYDDMVRDLPRYTRNVYRFLDEPVSPRTADWIKEKLRLKRNGTMIANNWQKVLTAKEKKRISEVCSELFSLVFSV